MLGDVRERWDIWAARGKLIMRKIVVESVATILADWVLWLLQPPAGRVGSREPEMTCAGVRIPLTHTGGSRLFL